MPNNNKDQRANISFTTDRDVKERLNKVVAWGQYTPLFDSITQQLVSILEKAENPSLVVAALITGDIKLEDILNFEKKKG